jgi:hypothetical protein
MDGWSAPVDLNLLLRARLEGEARALTEAQGPP